GEPHRELLCALLGQVAVPQLISDRDGAGVGAALPPGWPDALRHVPLLSTADGPASLATFLDRLGTDRTLAVTTADELAAMDDLEWRFGYGHLTHPSLEAPLFGVGRIGERWTWLDRAPKWSLPTLTQVIWVAPTLGPRTSDARWVEEARP